MHGWGWGSSSKVNSFHATLITRNVESQNGWGTRPPPSPCSNHGRRGQYAWPAVFIPWFVRIWRQQTGHERTRRIRGTLADQRLSGRVHRVPACKLSGNPGVPGAYFCQWPPPHCSVRQSCLTWAGAKRRSRDRLTSETHTLRRSSLAARATISLPGQNHYSASLGILHKRFLHQSRLFHLF